jgi:hypothetical protein
MDKIKQWVKRHWVLVMVLILWLGTALIDTFCDTSIAFYIGYGLGIWLIIRGIQWIIKRNKKKPTGK